MALAIFQLLDLKKGFSLPLWIAGAAKSAVKKIIGSSFDEYESIKVPKQKTLVEIKVHSCALIDQDSSALAISFAKSGLALDLTNNLEIWTIASLEKTYDQDLKKNDKLNIIAGFGVGINHKTSKICISNFAKELLYENLLELVPKGFKINLKIIIPKGKFLAKRTSNESFGIVEGLSIIGTTAEASASASPEQLTKAKLHLKEIVANKFCGTIVFVIGENGLDLAKKCDMQFPIIKVGNWIGPLLVEAAIRNIQNVILFGYHGKLIKLAGGIFHTHNHVADGRLEILVYLAVLEKFPLELIIQLSNLDNVEEAFIFLENFNSISANKLWNKLSNYVEKRSIEYIKRYTTTDMKVSAVLFDRSRKIRWSGINGKEYIINFKGL